MLRFLTGIVGGIALFVADPWNCFIVGELVILAVPLVYLLSKSLDVKSYIRLNLKPKYILIGLGCAFLLLLLNIVSSAVLTEIFGVSEAIEDTNARIVELSASPLGLTAVTLSLTLAGICEEFALRGFLQNTLTRRFSFIPAVLVSAAFFGLFHFDPQLVYIIASFVSGLALGAIYYRWGTLRNCPLSYEHNCSPFPDLWDIAKDKCKRRTYFEIIISMPMSKALTLS